MATMSSDFGLHLILGIESFVLSEEDKRLLEEVRPAGILFLARNFALGLPYDEWLAKWKQLHADIRQYTGRDRMFFTIDHEGDRWVRTPLPITRFPVAALYQSRAKEIAKATGAELRSLGINVSWAPICDVNSNPNNPIIGPRAFATTPEAASNYALAYLEGLSEEGIFGCAKHFPGHGDTHTDSHKELPVVTLTERDALQREIAAFVPLLDAHVPFLMTAHVMFPYIDSSNPATLSRYILGDLLRTKLGYNGIVVSDDVEMNAVKQQFERHETLAQAFTAGCDMFIVSRFTEPSGELTRMLDSHFRKGLFEKLISEESVTKARERVENVLRNAPQHAVTQLPLEHFQKNAALSCEVSYALGSKKEG